MWVSKKRMEEIEGRLAECERQDDLLKKSVRHLRGKVAICECPFKEGDLVHVKKSYGTFNGEVIEVCQSSDPGPIRPVPRVFIPGEGHAFFVRSGSQYVLMPKPSTINRGVTLHAGHVDRAED